MQVADGNDLQPVVVQRHADRAAAYGVVAVHKGIGQRLAQRLHRQQRRVLTRHLARHDAPRHRQRFEQEALRLAHQREGVAVKLPVVQKLVARCTLEARHLELQLRKIRQRRLVLAKQHRRRARQALALHQQPQPAQDLQRLARAGVFHAATADGLLQRQHHLAHIQPRHIPTLGGPVLPAFGGVQLFQQQALIRFARHRPRGIQHPLVSRAAKRHRHTRAVRHAHHQHFQAVRGGYTLHGRE